MQLKKLFSDIEDVNGIRKIIHSDTRICINVNRNHHKKQKIQGKYLLLRCQWILNCHLRKKEKEKRKNKKEKKYYLKENSN